MTGTPQTIHSPHGSPESSPPAAYPGVLVVDDDRMVLKLLEAVLPDHGFAVWSASNGPAAVEVYRERREDIAVVLLDVRMPGLDGPQTLTELQRIDPAVLCCFMSGYSGDYTIEDLHARGGLRCFDKPFRLDEVARELWQVVRGRVAC